ncbi:DUF805 domain-containing protein [Sphingomonas sp. LB-2]|uniref:DUF805 domain-containing protein n=1 Tax=Sphingomonas caeni TaxID=2984949 RepID=UPI00222E3053|nr:DUF805 domain-containing protein [Sphingomonas caeni]MCW3849000.1 DUF805 domain-containing protein [Sphingomonas caeni]
MNEVPSRYITLARGLKAFRETLNFTGRSTRTEVVSFWLLYMLAVLIFTVSHIVLLTLHLMPPHFLTDLVGFLFLLPSFALLARRLQDQNLPGWPGALLYAATQALGFWLTRDGPNPYQREIWWMAFVVVAITAYLIALFRAGTPGPNRYGPDPRLDAATQV